MFTKSFINPIKLFQRQAIFLMYHQIASHESDPWNLTVSTTNFEQHLQLLKKYTVLPVPEIIEQLKKKKLRRNCIGITFDDGYADNFHSAMPLLKQYNVPATFFVTSINIDNPKEFWWDELEHIIVSTSVLPKEISIRYKNINFYFDLEEEAILKDDIYCKQVDYKHDYLPTRRTQLYLKLWQIFSPLENTKQEDLLKIIRQWANVEQTCRATHSSMTTIALKQLAAHPLFTIGGHTETHPALACHCKEVQQEEISKNKSFLEYTVGSPIDLFAYPYGSYNHLTTEVLQNTNFQAAFTTKEGFATRQSDLFQLERYQVCNWRKELFEHKLQTWFH